MNETECEGTWTAPYVDESNTKQDRMAVSVKILRIMQDIGGYIQKKGKNDFHKYSYVMEADVMEHVGKACLKHGLVIVPRTIRTKMEKVEALGSAKPFLLTTVKVQYDFIDTDTGASLSVEMEGQGADNQDKGIYKAITGATKYALMKTLLLSSGDDPEQETGPTGITPHAASVAPNTLIPGVVLEYTLKQGNNPHKIRVALDDGDIVFTQHRLPCSETLIETCLGKQVNISYRKQGKFMELMELVPAEVTTKVLSERTTEPIESQEEFIAGQIKAYGSKEGVGKTGNPWTLHTLDLMTEAGEKIKATTFSLSLLSDETEWCPENVEHAVEMSEQVQFQLETTEKNGREFHNILRLELA